MSSTTTINPTPDQAFIDVLRKRAVARRPADSVRPVRAIALARLCKILPASSRESRRRAVRRIIANLRSQGHAIATTGDGYYLALTPEDHQDHQDFLRRSGLAHLTSAAADKRSMPAADASGQFRLFTT